MQKKHLTLIVVLNIFLIFLWGIIIRWLTNTRLKSFGTTVESTMGTKVNDIKKANFAALQSYLVETIATAKKSVVSITISKDVKFYVDDPSQINGPGTVQQQTATLWWWSGIIVSKKWYVLTNKHVVQDTTAKYSVILYDGKIYNVDKIWFDDLLDLAILKIIDTESKTPANLPTAIFLSLGMPVEVGQFSLTIGNTLSKYPQSVTMGIIWGKNKQLTVNGNNLYVGLYQTDAQVNPGNSWWPLLDINGTTIWITTAIVEWEGISFALPITKEFVEGTITSLETFWTIARPIIGIQYIEITPAIQTEKKISIDHGIYLTDVLTDLPAWEAGLKIWDIIVWINGNDIDMQMPFLYQLYTHIPGETISLDVVRNTEHLTLPITLWWNTQ